MRYLALLRGINVSGQKLIKMEQLRNQLSDAGLGDVKTYIQSGNILFEYKEVDPADLEHKIHQKIKEDYGFEVPVWVKTAPELLEITANNPLQKQADEDPKRMMVTFLSEIPAPERVEAMQNLNLQTEIWIPRGKNIFLYVPEGYGNAKLSNNFIESKLKVRATSRNWRTVTILTEMLSS